MSLVHVCMWVEYDIEEEIFDDDWASECNTVSTDLSRDKERRNLFVKMDNVDYGEGEAGVE